MGWYLPIHRWPKSAASAAEKMSPLQAELQNVTLNATLLCRQMEKECKANPCCWIHGDSLKIFSSSAPRANLTHPQIILLDPVHSRSSTWRVPSSSNERTRILNQMRQNWHQQIFAATVTTFIECSNTRRYSLEVTMILIPTAGLNLNERKDSIEIEIIICCVSKKQPILIFGGRTPTHPLQTSL